MGLKLSGGFFQERKFPRDKFFMRSFSRELFPAGGGGVFPGAIPYRG